MSSKNRTNESNEQKAVPALRMATGPRSVRGGAEERAVARDYFLIAMWNVGDLEKGRFDGINPMDILFDVSIDDAVWTAISRLLRHGISLHSVSMSTNSRGEFWPVWEDNDDRRFFPSVDLKLASSCSVVERHVRTWQESTSLHHEEWAFQIGVDALLKGIQWKCAAIAHLELYQPLEYQIGVLDDNGVTEYEDHNYTFPNPDEFLTWSGWWDARAYHKYYPAVDSDRSLIMSKYHKDSQGSERDDILTINRTIDFIKSQLYAALWNDIDPASAMGSISIRIDETLQTLCGVGDQKIGSSSYSAAFTKDGIGHFECLARRQLLGQTHSEIASIATKSRQDIDPTFTDAGISKAIRDTARLVGLRLRPPQPPGRKR